MSRSAACRSAVCWSVSEVLAEWVPRFAHEVGPFLFHGLIRTAHATRALSRKDTPAGPSWRAGWRCGPSESAVVKGLLRRRAG